MRVEFQDLLANAIEIETLAGRSFLRLSHQFSDHPHASGVFATLAREEEEHAAILTRQWHMVRTTPDALFPVKGEIGERQQMRLRTLRKISRMIHHDALALDDALRLCLTVEEGDDQTLQDMQASVGKLASVTRALETLSLQKHPEHNAGLITMARQRGVSKLAEWEIMDNASTAPRRRDDQWPKILRAMNETTRKYLRRSDGRVP